MLTQIQEQRRTTAVYFREEYCVTWLTILNVWIHKEARDAALLEWGLSALRHGIQNSMEAILACHPALSTNWCRMAISCEKKKRRFRTGPIWLLCGYCILPSQTESYGWWPLTDNLKPGCAHLLQLFSRLNQIFSYLQHFAFTFSQNIFMVVFLNPFLLSAISTD